MKFKLISLIAFFVFILNSTQAQKIVIADSVKVIGIFTEVVNEALNHFNTVGLGNYQLHYIHSKKEGTYFEAYIKKSKGKKSKKNSPHLLWFLDSYGSNYKKSDSLKIYISTVKDSLTKYVAFYANLSSIKKWKYIGTIKDLDTNKIKKVSLEIINNKNNLTFKNTWLQVPTRKGWIALDTNINKTPPVMRPFSNIDSLPQITLEQKIIADSLKNTAIAYKGLFYTMQKEGTGAPVNVTDNVTIFYKGSLFSNGNIFDQTKDKPITFPLNRLIEGWQIGMPLCKVGGKIRLYIPSGLAYGIRNLSADIPPNSTLVFDIEVVDAKGEVKE